MRAWLGDGTLISKSVSAGSATSWRAHTTRRRLSSESQKGRATVKMRLIAYTLSAMLRALEPEQVKILIDDLLDRAEDMLAEHPVGMQAVGFLRAVIDVPDDFGGDED